MTITVDSPPLVVTAHDVAAAPDRYRVLTGERPTGPLHLGHYLGTLRNRVALQALGVETYLVIADYQVLTDRVSPGEIEANVRDVVLDYLAVGMDPDRTTIFAHSGVPALNQLILPFLALTTVAELQRNPTVKDEADTAGLAAISGLMLTYPVHQAADILFCHGNVVPVGKDQLAHVEQTRLIARRFNARFADGRDVFTEPQAMLSPAPSLLGIDGRKMSKSRGNAISLKASDDETARLLRRAVTDGDRHITYDPARRPEVSSLILIAALLSDTAPEAIASAVGGRGAAALKSVVVDAVNEHLRPIRGRRAELAADPDLVTKILRVGSERANAVADRTLADVHEALRMSY